MSAPAKLKDRLLALGAGSKRSGIRRMADVLPEIELALSSGVPRDAVVEALNDDGIPMTMATFAANLYRLRRAPPKSKPGQLALVQPPVPAPASSAVALSVGETTYRYGQHDPRRLDDVMRSTPDMKALAKLARKERQ